MTNLIRFAAPFLWICGTLGATPVFYAISGDRVEIPRQFNAVTIGGGASVGSPFLLGDGSAGFVGGLAYRPDDGLFYSLFDDGAGSSTFASFA
jgi:hypothetical protein